ncbi:MAG: type II toxin-antitoxin system VapC family toxin, partial [Akkermansiaceae bacterium]
RPPLFYSIVTLWEIGIKMSKGGFEDLVHPDDWDRRIVEGFKEQGVACVGISQVHCKLIESLPFHHKDPFDRMLIAQALNGGLAVIGSDERFDHYGVKRVW